MLTKTQARGLLIIIVIISSLVYVYHRAHQSILEPGSKRVAILLPLTHHALAQIEQGLKTRLHELMPKHIACDVFNAQGDRVLLHALAHDVVSKGYDAVVAIATQPGLQLQQALNKAQSSTPFIFTAVSHPDQLGLVKPGTNQGNGCTGVTECVTYEQHAKQLAALRPQVTKVLLVYDPHQGSGLDPERVLLADKLAHVGITLDVVVVHQPRDVVAQVRGALTDHNVVVTLKDSTVHTAFDGLAAFCRERNIVLVASTLDAVGADIATGLHEADFGYAAAVLVQRVLVDGVNPEELPIVRLVDSNVVIDAEALKRKGFTLENNRVEEDIFRSSIQFNGVTLAQYQHIRVDLL